MTETLAYGYSSASSYGELSNEYQHDRVKMVFKNLSNLLLSSIEVALAFFGRVNPCLYHVGFCSVLTINVFYLCLRRRVNLHLHTICMHLFYPSTNSRFREQASVSDPGVYVKALQHLWRLDIITQREHD